MDRSLEWTWAQFSPSTNLVHFSIAIVGDVLVSSIDFDVATLIVDIVGMSAYGSPIAMSLQGIVDQDSSLVYIIWVGTRMKIFLVGFSSDDILTPTSLTQVLYAILQVMLLVLMMLVVCSWFNVNRGVTYYFIWDPGVG